MIQSAIDTTMNIPNDALSVPSGVYDSLNNLIGWDLGTTIIGGGLMATAAATDIIPYLGNVDDPVLYPIGALYIEQASQNRPIIESTETIFVDKIGSAIRSIIPGSDIIVPEEKTTDPMGYAVGGAVAGAIAIGALALIMSD